MQCQGIVRSEKYLKHWPCPRIATVKIYGGDFYNGGHCSGGHYCIRHARQKLRRLELAVDCVKKSIEKAEKKD